MDILGLEGQAISGVCFVQDYVELHFNGPILRLLANPLVETQNESVCFPESGSRAALCSLIEDCVARIELDEENYFQVMFVSGNRLTVQFYKTASDPPESLHFVAGLNEPVDVW